MMPEILGKARQGDVRMQIGAEFCRGLQRSIPLDPLHRICQESLRENDRERGIHANELGAHFRIRQKACARSLPLAMNQPSDKGE